MPARIVQTNTAPFRRAAVDPITLDIIENALRNARTEMDAVLFRTAMSPGIREQHDAFPMIANPQGKMVVGQFGSFIYGFTQGYDGTIEEGDIFLTNDPYAVDGAISHLNDWLTVMPIFKDGRMVAWAAMFGHMTDIGGKVPGSLPTDAAQLFEEGLQIPPVKIYRKGELNEEILALALRNCRLPQWNRSDFNGIVAALRLTERRILEMCSRFGDDTFIAAMQEMLDRNKRAMGAIIQMVVPEKKAYFEDYIDDDGLGMGPYKVACTMWREGTRAIFDFTGTDPQSVSSVNFLLNEEMFKMFLGAFTINLFDPQILFNDGFYDLVDVRIPLGCILKPRRPAALSCRTHMLGRIFDIMGGVLGQGAPDALNAAGFSDSPHFMYSGYDRNGEWYQLYQIGFGGIPGRPVGDGPDGHSLWPAFTNVPNEFLESYFPLRIVSYESIPDSGGAGLHRGGNGVSLGYMFLEPGEISIHDDRWLTHPWGVNGGLPGARSNKLMRRADGTEERLHSKCDRIPVAPGDVLYFNTWGGGGWGDPLKRDPAKVAKDVERGLVTAAGARRYGVVLGPDGGVDARATADLRERMARERGATALFDRGGTIEELKARCKAETGFDPPRTPQFQKWMRRGVEAT
jgi:N-methylhydantoinase B